jgi:hypothetical protein
MYNYSPYTPGTTNVHGSKRPKYGMPYQPPGYGLPPLTGPSNVPPISPGGTVAIDTNEQIRQGAAGDWSNADRQNALNGYGSTDAFFNGMMGNGGYTPEMIQSEKNSLSGEYTDMGNSLASQINSALSQRGLGQNVYAGQQARQRAAFEGAGQVGRLDNTIRQQQLQNEFQGAQGAQGNAAQKAALYGRVTQETAMGMIHPEAELPGSKYYSPMPGGGTGGGRPILGGPVGSWGGGGVGGGGVSPVARARQYSTNYQPQMGGY